MATRYFASLGANRAGSGFRALVYDSLCGQTCKNLLNPHFFWFQSPIAGSGTKRLYDGRSQSLCNVAQTTDTICMWASRVLYIGALPDLEMHRQAAALLCVGLERPFGVRLETGQAVLTRSALVGPQIMHAVETFGGRCAYLLFDPDAADYEYLRSGSGDEAVSGVFVDFAEEKSWIQILHAIGAAEGIAATQSLLTGLELATSLGAKPVIDARIKAVIELLANDTGESVPIERLAQQVDISASRLAHLFKEQVGIPIRMFRTWYRLKTAAQYLSEGMLLTEAALRAGFYDSAHFANTFRDTFGLPPSAVFGQQRALKWFIASATAAALA